MRAQDPDRERGAQGLRPCAFFKHIGFTISNAVRSFFGAMTLSRIVNVAGGRPDDALLPSTSTASARRSRSRPTSRCSRSAATSRRRKTCRRASATCSRRLYLASMVLKHYREPGPARGRPAAGRVRLPLAPLPGAGAAPRLPAELPGALARGDHARRSSSRAGSPTPRPRTELNPKIAELVMNPARRASGSATTSTGRWSRRITSGSCSMALELAIAAEPLEKKIRVEGIKTGLITALDLPGQVREARAAGLINEAEASQLRDYDRKVMDIIDVDDFESAGARRRKLLRNPAGRRQPPGGVRSRRDGRRLSLAIRHLDTGRST